MLLMRAKRGQAILESLIVLLVLLAAFFFFFDFTYGIVAQLHLNNAAARAARADAVGFNSFHRAKAIRVATIPVAGKRLAPGDGRIVNGPEAELALARSLLQSQNDSEARGILHYERWDTLQHAVRRKGDITTSTVSMEIPRSLPTRLGSLFGAQMNPEGMRRLTATWGIEDHASYYLTTGDE
jgi:Flp pilus assembly protein TadG